MNNQLSYKVIKYLQESNLPKAEKRIIIKFLANAKDSTVLFIIPLLENDKNFENNFIEHLKSRKIEETKNIERQIISLIKK